MDALIGTELSGMVVKSDDTYIVVFQEPTSQLTNNLGDIFHRLVAADLRRSVDTNKRKVVENYELRKPDSWSKYPALAANGGLHVTLGAQEPNEAHYEFRITGYDFIPSLTTSDPVLMPGFYALTLAPLTTIDVDRAHASVIQLFKK
jgi:hypothetical protein